MKPLTRYLRRRLGAQDFAKLPPIIALFLVAAGILLSYAFASTLAQRSQDEFVSYTRQQSATVAAHLTTEFSHYEQLLLDNAGLFSMHRQVSREEWTAFVRSSKVTERFPALVGIGYTPYLSAAQVDSFEAEVRAQGITNYAVTPDGVRDNYAPILYLEPESPSNLHALGYDMSSESSRRTAMEKARDSATVQMSAPVLLVQDSNAPTRRGVLLFYPIFTPGADVSTVEGRREHLEGYVYAVARPQDTLGDIDKKTIAFDQISYTLSDGDDLTSISGQTVDRPENSLEYNDTRVVKILGRTWRLDLTTYQPTLQRLTSPGILLLMGITLSSAMGVALYRLLRRSFESLVTSHEETLMQTKNDLLALASHQLRTPASGVKQYLGLLTQGFVGELTPEQAAIAIKAYAANERQLETINQLLHVAKADADQLALRYKVFDLVPMVKEVVDSMQTEAKLKNIMIHVATPDICETLADERYVRMVIENLISNAIKYSLNDRHVDIRVTKGARAVQVIVNDQGVGIDPRDFAKLFVKFSRVDNPLSHQESGTGLGLFLAQRIARAHHGDITVESTLGGGSSFMFTLPRKYTKEPRRKS